MSVDRSLEEAGYFLDEFTSEVSIHLVLDIPFWPST